MLQNIKFQLQKKNTTNFAGQMVLIKHLKKESLLGVSKNHCKFSYLRRNLPVRQNVTD